MISQSLRDLSVQPQRWPHPSRHTQGRPKQSTRQSLLNAAQLQINTGQLRSTSKITAQTENNILRADSYGPRICKSSSIVIYAVAKSIHQPLGRQQVRSQVTARTHAQTCTHSDPRVQSEGLGQGLGLKQRLRELCVLPGRCGILGAVC